MNSSGIGPVRAQWEKMRGNGVSGAMDKWDGGTVQRWRMSIFTRLAFCTHFVVFLAGMRCKAVTGGTGR